MNAMTTVRSLTVKETIERVARLLYTETDGSFGLTEKTVDVLSRMHDDNSGTLALFIKCMTTGSENSKDCVNLLIREMIQKVRKADELTAQDGLCLTDDDYQSWYPTSHIRVLQLWNTYNVLDEAGIQDDTGEIMDSISYIAGGMNHEYEEDLRELLRDKYWRGVAAVSATRVYGASTSDSREYRKWAGEHPDVGSVIQIASERDTLNVATIGAVLDARKSSIKPLQEGVL